MTHTPVIDLRDVSFRRNGTTILENVSLTVHQGEHWVLLGANGAGKSTVLGLCGAQMFPTTGTVDLLGHRVGRVELRALRTNIGHVNPRQAFEASITPIDAVLSGITGTPALMMRWQPTEAQERRAAELLAILGLERRTHDRWATLSQGERGRALIARALIADPALVLLDEPSTGLDVAAREQLLDTIAVLAHSDPDRGSVLVTHHLEEIPETTTHALLLARGQVVATGRIDEVLTSENVTRTFDYPITVGRDDTRWSARKAPALTSAVSR